MENEWATFWWVIKGIMDTTAHELQSRHSVSTFSLDRFFGHKFPTIPSPLGINIIDHHRLLFFPKKHLSWSPGHAYLIMCAYQFQKNSDHGFSLIKHKIWIISGIIKKYQNSNKHVQDVRFPEKYTPMVVWI